MMQDIDREELVGLAERYCAGDWDDKAATRLAEALRVSAHARRWFIEFMDLHSCARLGMFERGRFDGGGKLSLGVVARGCFALAAPARFALATPQRIALSVATCALIASLVVMAATPAPLFRPWRWGQQVEQVVIAASISAAADCHWEQADAAIVVGTQLAAGRRLQLLEGSVELTFADGAVVTLIGPATLVVESPARGSLREGMLSAKVGEEARGFTVQTPGATIVDLGTEFGISVPPRDEQSGQPLGQEEVHVFAGVVEVSFANEALPVRRLGASEALRFASSAREQTKKGGVEQLAATQRARFPRTIDRDGKLTTAAALPADRHPPVTRGLVLWLAADGAIRCTSDNHVVSWNDMATDDKQQLQHARQHYHERRPLWIAEAFYGQPAVRFDGDDYLALLGADRLGISGQPYEMYIVARSSSPEIQFLVGGGTEEFELHLNGESGGRFIPTGYFGGAGASDLGSPSEFTDGRPHLFAARVLPDQEFRGVLEIDGRVSGDLTIDDVRGYSELALRLGMRHDGSFGLRGEIAEVLVFGKPLTVVEQTEMRRYFAGKYSLPIQ